MIKLKDLLREVDEDKDPRIASIEDEREWKMPDVDHMFSMRFEREGDSVFILKNPAMKVYKIKKGPFILEEPIENHENNFQKGLVAPIKNQGISAFDKSKEIKKHEFPTFIKLINFFDTYKQD
jgi:predicted transcriptional regulator